MDVLCDSSSIISLTDACLGPILMDLHYKYKTRFLISKEVEDESINNPLRKEIKQYEYSAYKIKHLLNLGVIQKIQPGRQIKDITDQIMNSANHLFFAMGRPIRLVHRGEAEILATSHLLGIKLILMDERTTRLLIEAPFILKEHLEDEFNTNILVNKNNLRIFSKLTKGLSVIRSSEIVALGYEIGYFDKYKKLKKEMFHASLYKLRASGCSVSFEEIDEFCRGLK